jgi:hypothetical protein
MKITGEGHWGGDPERHCAELRIVAGNCDEATTLAALFRVLGNPETRAELLGVAKDIDARTEALAVEADHRRDLVTA